MKYIFLFVICLSTKLLLAQEIIFRTNVESLRLREQPNMGSKVFKMVQKGTLLKWTGLRSEQKINTDWKGVKVADYWYKVNFDGWREDSTAWVFGKGVVFDGLINNDSIQNVDNEWIRLEKSNESNFNKIPTSKVIWIPNPIKKQQPYGVIHDNFTLKYDNGTSKTFKNDSDEFNTDYDGEIPEIGYYFLSYSTPCCGGNSIVNRKNGKEIDVPELKFHQNKGKKAVPIFSIDKKTAVFTNSCEPDYEHGVGIFNFKDDKIESIFFWYHTHFYDFRFITNRSGIAKLQNDTYWKITLK